MTTESALVALAIALAAAWLIRRAWRKARAKYEAGPCCGAGCGCAKPVLFGPKKSHRGKTEAKP